VLIRPVLFILTLPATLLTFGLFAFVLNAAMVGLAAWLVDGFEITNILSGLALTIIVAFIHAAAFIAFGRRK
jgi:putative membrane protein